MPDDRNDPHASAALSVSGDDALPVDLEGPTERPFRPFPRAWLERTVFDIFTEVAAAHADKTALDDGERFLTYREVREAALKLARRIAGTLERGNAIGIALPNGATYPVAMLAALAAGRPYVPLDLSFPEARNRLILRQSGIKAVVVDERTRDALARMDPTLRQLDFAGEDGGSEDTALAPSPDDIAFVIYTSGSTGQPKGAYFDQRSLLHDAMRHINSAHQSAEDRVALIFAPTVRAAQEDIYGALLTGATTFVVDVRSKGLQELVRALRRGRITMCFSVPFVFRRLVELCTDRKVFETIRIYCLAGDRVFASDVELFRKHFPATSRFAVGVGSTETNFYTYWFIPPERPLAEAMVPVGYVPPGYRVAMVDAEGKPVPRGELGEIVVSGRYIALGYWNDAALTERTFSASPDDPAVRVFRMGDLGRMRPDGLVELIGRKDRQIKIRGNRIEPAEVEGAIRRHPAVRDGVVIPRAEGEAVELAAYVVLAQDARLTSAELATWLTRHLPDYMRPREINFVDEFPMLGNFKPDVMALTEMDRRRTGAAGPGRATATAATTPAPAVDHAVAEAVAAAWKRLLGADSFEKNVTWESAGGDSAAGMELIFELEERLRRRIGMDLLAPGTRPSELIATLERAGAEGGLASPTPAPQRARPQLFFLPGLLGPLLNIMRFAQTLADDADVHVLDYLPVDPAKPKPVDLDDVVADVVDQIRALAGAGEPIRLLGYSMGGLVAYQAARVMAEQGSAIEFLGIVDYSPVAWTTPWYELGRESLVERVMRIAMRGTSAKITPGRFFQRLLERQLNRQR
ncbi:MAG TPA: alpha/beta fold hydrolase, partial [Alphaproteobacteria bacterium]|nr:alpha/beta fold hydrolase [Alphaproteobacteria bacterium]